MNGVIGFKLYTSFASRKMAILQKKSGKPCTWYGTNRKVLVSLTFSLQPNESQRRRHCNDGSYRKLSHNAELFLLVNHGIYQVSQFVGYRSHNISNISRKISASTIPILGEIGYTPMYGIRFLKTIMVVKMVCYLGFYHLKSLKSCQMSWTITTFPS